MTLPDGFHAAYEHDPHQPGRIRWTLHDDGGAVATGTAPTKELAEAAASGACAGFNAGATFGHTKDLLAELAELSRVYPILQYFTWDHLPAGPLHAASRQYAKQARTTARRHPHGNTETAEALRKLLEAKDAAVRAELPSPPHDTESETP